MVVVQEKEEKRAKILKGAAFKFRLSETKEAELRRKCKKNPKKVSDQIGGEVQMRMRKFSTNIVEGIVWQEDWQDITAEVIKLAKKEVN